MTSIYIKDKYPVENININNLIFNIDKSCIKSIIFNKIPYYHVEIIYNISEYSINNINAYALIDNNRLIINYFTVTLSNDTDDKIYLLDDIASSMKNVFTSNRDLNDNITFYHQYGDYIGRISSFISTILLRFLMFICIYLYINFIII